jgi:hypothetical protein
VLTDAPITLDDPLRAYFRKKIIKSLGLRGLDVVVDSDGTACVRDGVAAILGEQPAANEEIITSLSEPKLYVGANDRARAAAAAAGVDPGEASACWRRSSGQRPDVPSRARPCDRRPGVQRPPTACHGAQAAPLVPPRRGHVP